MQINKVVFFKQQDEVVIEVPSVLWSKLRKLKDLRDRHKIDLRQPEPLIDKDWELKTTYGQADIQMVIATPKAPVGAQKNQKIKKKIKKWKLTKEDDADNDGPRVLEQRVVEDAGGQGRDIEDGVYQSGVPIRTHHHDIIHNDDDDDITSPGH